MVDVTTLADAIGRTRRLLRDYKLENADLDARLLVEWATQTTRKDALLTPERFLPEDQVEKLHVAVEKRLSGMPVHRILGEREFYGIPFTLSADTLEPRPDTETLVDLILPVIAEVAMTKGHVSLLDMGTGTGAIAIAILKNAPLARAVAVDIAKGALQTVVANAKNAGVADRLAVCESDWFENVTGQFDVIVSNPPYIPQADIAKLDREVRDHDPLRALVGGEDGLDFYRALATQSAQYLTKTGHIAVEIGIGQERDVSALFMQSGFRCLEMRPDLSGVTRALLFAR